MAAKTTRAAKKVFQSVAGIFAYRFGRPRLPAAFEYRPANNIDTLPTGFRALDAALGIGGLPYGKITELIGPPASGGPAVVAARIASKAQRKQQVVTIIDMSHSFNPRQAELSGLAAAHLLLTRPDTVFDALTTLEKSARAGGVVMVVMGVVSGLLNRAEPHLLATLLGRLRTIVRASDSLFLFVTASQNNAPYRPATYPAGFPLAELADIRLWVQEESWTRTGYKATLTVIKNRFAVAGKSAGIRLKLGPDGR